MFGSVLTYVTLRILGDGPDGGEYNALQRGRNWIHEHGGATYITSWGKFWLSVISILLFFHDQSSFLYLALTPEIPDVDA